MTRYAVAAVSLVAIAVSTAFAPLWLAFVVLVASIVVVRVMKRRVA